MTYKTFCEELKERILNEKVWGLTEKEYKFYPDGYMATGNEKERKFIRETNRKYHALESDVLKGDFIVLGVNKKPLTFRTRFQIEYLFEEYQKEGWNRVRDIIDENIKLAKKLQKDEGLNDVDNYEAVKKRLIIRPINFVRNEAELDGILYKVCGDIALVVYYVLYDNACGLGTMKMSTDRLDKWGKKFGEVFEEALQNTYDQDGPRMYTNILEMCEMPSEKGNFMSTEYETPEPIELYAPVITTTRRINGAIAMFYPDVKEKIAEIFGGNYYVVFTSINEATLHPVGLIDPRQSEKALQELDEKFGEQEMLSKKVYLYDCVNGTFSALKL